MSVTPVVQHHTYGWLHYTVEEYNKLLKKPNRDWSLAAQVGMKIDGIYEYNQDPALMYKFLQISSGKSRRSGWMLRSLVVGLLNQWARFSIFLVANCSVKPIVYIQDGGFFCREHNKWNSLLAGSRALFFLRFWFEYLISGPWSYRDFLEAGPKPYDTRQ